MPADGYTVNLAALEDVGIRMLKCTNDINYALDTLEARAKKELDEAHWQDSAKNAYTAAKANWDAAARSMKDKLNSAFTALVDIVDDYSLSEARSLKAMQDTGLA